MNKFKKNLEYLIHEERAQGNNNPGQLRKSERWINDFINSFANPSIDELWDIADHFGISIDDLIKKDIAAKGKIARKEIKMIIIDADDCLSDSALYFNEKGENWRKVNLLDQQAIADLTSKKIDVAFICKTESVTFFKAVAKAWGVKKISSTTTAIKKWMDETKIKERNVAYLGSDPTLHQKFSASASPANSSNASSEIQLNTKAGEGCLMEFLQEYLK